MFRAARFVLCVSVLVMSVEAAVPRGCVASAPLGSFQLSVKPPGEGSARAIRQVNAIEKGYKLVYTPREIPTEYNKKARVALVLAPAGKDAKLTVFETEEAGKPAEWIAPFRVAVVGVVFGPQGLDHKKVESLMAKDQELITQLADYAEQTAQVESLIDTLTAAERGSRSMDAALSGFAAQSGTAIPKLDRTAPTDQQAMALMRALNPALTSYDPLAPQSAARLQQSAGLAASVASVFFGSNVGLAAGGAAMVQNMRTLLFPGTDFRSALAQPAAEDGLTLCAKRQATKSRTRMAYLWAYRVPNADAPAVSLASVVNVPLGAVSPIAVQTKSASDWAALARAREWSLASDGKTLPVSVKPAASGQSLEIDLKNAKVPPGEYKFAAKWDWTSFEVPGKVLVYSMPNLKPAAIERASADRLVDGSGPVNLKLSGADFQFVEKLTIDKQPVEFALPVGRRSGPQQTIVAPLDTNRFRAGKHEIALYQPDGSAVEVPVRVLPPNPKIENAPLRVNLGEKEQSVLLRGSGLDRIEKIDSPAAEIVLGEAARDGSSREVKIRLAASAAKGQHGALALHVEGMESPLEIADGLAVAGPRPRIVAVDTSLADDPGMISLRPGELPAGSVAGFAMKLSDVEGRSVVHLTCGGEDKAIRPGEKTGSARLDAAGPEMLFLSLDPAAIGRSGCTLTAVVEAISGKSDETTLGRVIRLPRIDSFTLTDEKSGASSYVGVLTGRDLETIDRAGWDAQNGSATAGLPRPVPGEGDRQSLRVLLPWPAPSPHAPVYVWLRGETEGRATRAKL